MIDLRNIPAIRAEAEHQAEERQDALARRSYLCAWRDMPRSSRDIRIAAHLDLLCDLTRPASRDAVARLVAAKLGIECGATAPILLRIKGVDPSTIWSLSVRSDIDMDRIPSVTVDQRGFVEPGAFPDSPIATVVPGISVVTDPAEALRLIALHVLGAERLDAALVRS